MNRYLKRLQRVGIGIMALVILAIAPAAATFAQADAVDFRDGVLATARTDGQARVIINLRTDITTLDAARAQNSIADAQARVLAALGTNNARTEGAFRSTDFELIRQYERVPGLAGNISAAGLQALANHPDIASIQLDETGTGGLAQARTIIKADQVITNLGVTGEGIKVAVVDSGIDTDHVFLADDINQFGICYTNADCAPNNTSSSSNPEDESGHGTATSGVITSSSGAHPGIAPDVVIVPVRVLNSQNVGFVSDWVAGLDWIITNQGGLGVDVVNISIQSDATYTSACDAVYPALTSAVNQLVNSGVPVVSITGNYELANQISAPGCLSNAIAVGATYDFNGNYESARCNDANAQIDKVACFSNSGALMDLLAPGSIINAPQFNTAQNSVWSGTSIAGPMVSAVAAMLLDINPALTPAQIETILKETGKAVTDPRNGRTYSRIDALAAIATQLKGVELIGPDGTVFVGTPVFQWEDQPTSPRFRVQVRNVDLDRITLDQVYFRGDLCNGTICAGELGGFLIAGSNQWRVQTYVNASTPAVWSNWMSFNAAAPAILTPVGGNTTVTTANPEITWEELDGSTWYRVYIGGPLKDLSFDEYLEWHEASEICVDGTCAVTPAGLANQRYDGDNIIYIQGWVTEELGVWSTPRTFTVNVSPPTPPVVGAATETDTLTPTYNWTFTGSNATYAQIRVSDSNGQKVLERWFERDEVCGTLEGTTCSLESPVSLIDGTSYVYEVRGWGPGGVSTFDGPEAFDINLETPVTPSALNVELNRGDPTFTWVNDPAAEWFKLTVTGNTTGEIISQWYQRDDGVTCELICVLTPNIYLRNDTYNWSLQSWGNRSFSPGTAQGDPIVLNLATPQPPVVGDMITLRMNLEVWHNQDRFTFQWPDVDNAAWYQVEIRTPADEELYRKWHRRTETCEEGTCAIYPTIYFKNANNYEWQVRAWGPAGIGPWSTTATFTVNGSTQNTAPDVSTATPTGTITTSYPTFTWPTRSGTTWVQISLERANDGEIYKAWFETDNLGCGDGIGTCTLDQDALGGLELLDNTYNFQLRFYGPAGISPWSNERGFVVNAPVASQIQTILSPADDATITGLEVTIQWLAPANTTFYRVNLTDTETDQTTRTWYANTDLGCIEPGDVCTLNETYATGVYEWSISTWGPGTVGTTNYATTTPRTLTVLN